MTSTEPTAVATSFRTATITSAFCAAAAVLYAAVRADPSPEVAFFFSVAPLFAVILWLHSDAQRTGVGAVHDLGLFLCIAWPFVIPWYAWKTRGRSGWRLAVGLFALAWSPYLSWFVVAWGIYGVQYALWYFRTSD